MPMRHRTLAGTLAVLAIVVLLNVAQTRTAPSESASSLGPRQEMQQQHQQSDVPVLTALTVTVGGTAQPLAPTFSSTVKYYTVVVGTAVTRITVAGTGDTVAYEETDGTPHAAGANSRSEGNGAASSPSSA